MKHFLVDSLRSLKHLSGVSLWTGLGISAIATLPAWGAERIQFFYGPFEPTILVEDLEAIAKVENPREIDAAWVSQLNDEQLNTFQTVLNARFEIDVVTLSRVGYSRVGEGLLHRLGQIVQTDAGLTGEKALRAALIQSASDDGNVQLLEVIQHFPLETIQIDLPLLRQVLAENQQTFQRQVSVIEDLQAQAQTSRPEALPDIDFNQPGEYVWRRETLTFINLERPEPSIADLYLPNRSADVPVIVISHGVASNRQTFTYLAKHLVSHGYAVVAVDHADTTTEKFSRFLAGLEGPPDSQSLLHRPKDISAVLDALEQMQVEDLAVRSLNLTSVGVIGHSLGGYTALASAGAQIQRNLLLEVCSQPVDEQPLLNLSMLLQCRFNELPDHASLNVKDERIQAVMAINPLTSHIFGSSGMEALTVPTMVVASTDDYFVPALIEQIEPFQWISAEEKYLAIIENGTHFTALDAGEQVFPTPDFLIGADPALAQPALRSLTLAFFNRHLLDQAESEVYLSSGYWAAFNAEPFGVTLAR